MFLNTGQHGKIVSNLIVRVLTQQEQRHGSKLSHLLHRRGQGFQEDREVRGDHSLREYHLCQEALEDPEKQTDNQSYDTSDNPHNLSQPYFNVTRDHPFNIFPRDDLP